MKATVSVFLFNFAIWFLLTYFLLSWNRANICLYNFSQPDSMISLFLQTSLGSSMFSAFLLCALVRYGTTSSGTLSLVTCCLGLSFWKSRCVQKHCCIKELSELLFSESFHYKNHYHDYNVFTVKFFQNIS